MDVVYGSINVAMLGNIYCPVIMVVMLKLHQLNFVYIKLCFVFIFFHIDNKPVNVGNKLYNLV